MLFINSCSEEPVIEKQKPDTVGVALENNILNFATPADFKSAIELVEMADDMMNVTLTPGFNSLYQEQNSKLKSGEEFEEDTLVLSDLFASVLNSKREIIVANILYKVTPHGTFFGTVDNLERMRELGELDNIADLLIPVSSSLKSTHALDNTYTIQGEDNLLLYNTFKDGSNFEFDPDPSEGGGGSGGTGNSGGSGGIGGGSSPKPGVYPEPDFNNSSDIGTVTEKDKTLFGKGWSYVFGFDKSVTKTFRNDSKKRIKAYLYAHNYKVFTEIGIKVKCQGDRLIGWTKCNTDELRIGWNYLEFKEKWPSLGQTDLNQIYQTAEPYYNWVTQEYNRYLRYVNTTYKAETFGTIEIFIGDDLIEYERNITDKDLYGYIQTAYNYAKGKLKDGDEVRAIRKWASSTPETATIHISENHDKAYNTDVLNYRFDWDVGVLVHVSKETFSGDILKILEGINNIAVEYEIVKADMYAIGRNGNEWKGGRFKYKMD